MWSIGKGSKGICNSKAFILKWWWINFIIAQDLFQMLRPISQVLRCMEIQKGLMCFGENHDPCGLTTLENLIIKHGSWSEQEISNFKINGGLEVVNFDVIHTVQCTTFGIFVSVVGFVEIVPVPSGLAPISHVPISWLSKWPIWRWHLVEHSPSILHAPTFFMYMSTRLHPTKTLDSQPLWMICSWTFLPSSGATKPACAFYHFNKSEFVGTHSFLLHLLEKLDHLLRLPILNIFCKLFIQCKNVQLHCAWCQNNPICCHTWWVSLVLKPESFLHLEMCDPGTFHLPTISNPDQTDQACILPTLGINAIYK